MKINWDNVQVKIAICGRARHAHGVTNTDRIIRHTDNGLGLIWIGEGEVLTREGWIPLRPGVCMWSKPGWEYHLKNNPNNPIGNYFIHFDLLDRQGEPYRGELPPEVLLPPDAELLGPIMSRIVYLVLQAQHADIMAEAPTEGPELEAATGLLTGLLIDLDAQSDGDYGAEDATLTCHRPAMFEAATRLAEAIEQQPRIADLAKQHGYSINQFTRIFRRIIGQTPKAYALSMRIHKATNLLRQSDLPVKEIAFLTGYESVYSFSAQFKRSTGLSPTEFRKREAGGES